MPEHFDESDADGLAINIEHTTAQDFGSLCVNDALLYTLLKRSLAFLNAANRVAKAGGCRLIQGLFTTRRSRVQGIGIS